MGNVTIDSFLPFRNAGDEVSSRFIELAVGLAYSERIRTNLGLAAIDKLSVHKSLSRRQDQLTMQFDKLSSSGVLRMSQFSVHAIGVPGIKWGEQEKAQWLAMQSKKRSYFSEVVAKIEALPECFIVEQYGELIYAAETYPLHVVKSREWDGSKKTAFITGGVHGYETSGVQGALRFLQEKAMVYMPHFNIVVAPCISPWAYETINRWNPHAIDPNRSFYPSSPSEEASALMQYLAKHSFDFAVHIDLHETTDTDNSEFGPALAARDAVDPDIWLIPDGFYTVGDTQNPQHEFQTAIIESVEKVTHIAPADEHGKLIGITVAQRGVINYEIGSLGLCAGVSGAPYCTTTEVYPDSSNVDDDNCIDAQVAAVCGGFEFVLACD
jgi:hypothetical protein